MPQEGHADVQELNVRAGGEEQTAGRVGSCYRPPVSPVGSPNMQAPGAPGGSSLAAEPPSRKPHWVLVFRVDPIGLRLVPRPALALARVRAIRIRPCALTRLASAITAVGGRTRICQLAARPLPLGASVS
jgi:hypothetical protein